MSSSAKGERKLGKEARPTKNEPSINGEPQAVHNMLNQPFLRSNAFHMSREELAELPKQQNIEKSDWQEAESTIHKQQLEREARLGTN